MTRDEKRRRIQKQDGKAFETYNVEIKTTFLDPRYRPPLESCNVIADTGPLNVFELMPISENLPSFKGRWDEKKEALDVDIEGVSKAEWRRFKDGRQGYSGHHSKRVSSAKGWAYEVSISTPGGMVFEATVCFNLLRKIGFEASMQPFAGKLDTKVVRADD
jgi:hypothetical protein